MNRLFCFLVFSILAGGCGSEIPGETLEPDPSLTCKATPGPPVLGAYALVPAFSETLSLGQLDSPVELVQHPTDDDIWYVANLLGTIVFFDSGSPAAPTVALDIEDILFTGHAESGLMSLAFHPDFANTPYVYLSYHATVGNPFTSRIARFTVAPDGTFAKDSLTVITDEPQPASSHSGNQIDFGPDGFLYWVLGDGRNPGDPYGNGQNPFTRKGVVLRIDVDNPSDGNAFGIPADNPFVDGVGGAPEVYAYGLRNPWRFSFDSETGQLWVGDVGQDTTEEINEVVSGGNYGWPIMEGDLCYPANDDACDQTGLIPPRVALSHLEAASVTCGHVYRGAELPSLTGKLIFADYVSGAVWSLDPITGGVSLILESGLNIASFERGRDERLYAVAYSPSGSDVYQLVPAEPSIANFPKSLSETGCMDPDDTSLPGHGVHPYGLQSPLWSDGASKERFLALPANKHIAVDDDGDFRFPVGSVLIKHFGFEGVLHETRLLMHHETGWAGYSYEWNDAQTDAQLLSYGKTKDLPNGVKWRYPTSGQCTRCHTAASGIILGPEVAQFPPHEGPSSPLATLFEQGLFEPKFTEVQQLPNPAGPMPDPHDSQSELQDRAKSYLHSNCAGCHRPEGTSQAGMDLRWTTSLEDMKICGVEPKNGYLYTGNTDLRLVSPGIPEESILYLRMTTLNTFRMPDLGTHFVDEDGTQLIHDWVSAMQGCP